MLIILKITCDSDPAGWRLPMLTDVTFVEAFVRQGNMRNGHVTCRLSPDDGAIFIENSWEVWMWGLWFTEQRDAVSLHHRKHRTLQDHSATSTQTQTTAFHPLTHRFTNTNYTQYSYQSQWCWRCYCLFPLRTHTSKHHCPFWRCRWWYNTNRLVFPTHLHTDSFVVWACSSSQSIQQGSPQPHSSETKSHLQTAESCWGSQSDELWGRYGLCTFTKPWGSHQIVSENYSETINAHRTIHKHQHLSMEGGF